MRIVRLLVILVVGYVALGLIADAAIGYFQPRSEGTAVLRTFDAAGGGAQDTVLSLLDDDGQLWVESGHWFRGWYHRVLANQWNERITRTPPGSQISVMVSRRGTLRRLAIVVGTQPTNQWDLQPVEEASPAQERHREAWLTGRS